MTKTRLSQPPEVAALRAEVRRLRAEVENLESRLHEWDDDHSDRWALWPYSWILAGCDKVNECFHSLQLNNGRRALRRHNDKSRRRHSREEALREQVLTQRSTRSRVRPRKERQLSVCDAVPLRMI